MKKGRGDGSKGGTSLGMNSRVFMHLMQFFYT